jgi:two-component system cell cycle response regulator
MNTRVLVVDDEDTLRMVISEVLEDDGYDVTTAASGEDALDMFRQQPFPIVVTDVIMGKMSGLELLQEVKLLDTEALVVVMTSQASLDKATTAIRSGAYDFLTKPFEELDVISAVVNRANEKVQLLKRNKSLMVSLKKHTEELERLNSNLEDLAIHDGLTGLHNHRYFRESLDQELSRSSRHERPFSLVFMDVDHFKRFNDTYGHLAGDEVLKGLSRIFTIGKRASTILARYGGEEFVAMLPEAAKSKALEYAKLVRSRVEAAMFKDYDGRELGKVTISLGVSTFPEDGTDPKNLMEFADRALYQAKKDGRNQVSAQGAKAQESSS